LLLILRLLLETLGIPLALETPAAGAAAARPASVAAVRAVRRPTADRRRCRRHQTLLLLLTQPPDWA